LTRIPLSRDGYAVPHDPKKSPAPAPDEESILPAPVTIPAARYAFAASPPCPFCGEDRADKTANVDINWPVLDVASVRDHFVDDLPCCVRCKAKYQRMDDFFISLPRIFGYPISFAYRLLYVPRVRIWLKVHARREAVEMQTTRAWRRAVCDRFQWVMFYGALWSLTALAISDAYPEPLALRGPSYLLMWAIALLAAASVVAGLAQWLRFTFSKR
jgi:hypothetical protein